ncbi:MICOS complex subunit MIC10-like [Sipha flava]|uniref:MICOS complex subunit MIC10 n=1 Tax=Sipha flava TaxID=143950 RepID=A0A8B8FLI9_9HEMI|nr:MICOS complex subunit MIC10-like [Sipha flava]
MSKTYKEDEISIRVDRCLYDSAIKFGGGLIVGGVASLLFFKRKKWPLIMGSGFGLGLAYENCEKDLKEFFTST